MSFFHVERAVAAAAGKAGDPVRAVVTDYPSRPVRLIVPFPPGGGADFMGRIISLGLTKKRGYTVALKRRYVTQGFRICPR
jgi:tripartite-type tricarboxylate transporter receptor subunit TctC